MTQRAIYICPWSRGNEEHEHTSYGVGVCPTCGRCATCGLTEKYHTRGGAYECVNALAKRIDELEGLTKVVQMVAHAVTCRCGRPAIEHECSECYKIK